MVTEYDDYGRPVRTGLLNTANVPTTFPVLADEMWTQTFYDGFDGINTINQPQYIGRPRLNSIMLLDGNQISTDTIIRLLEL